MISKILVATDGSEHTKKALDFAADMAVSHGADVHLVHVVSEGGTVPESIRKFLEIEYPNYSIGDIYMQLTGGKVINEAVGAIRKKGVRKLNAEILLGNPVREILEFAHDNHIDLIVVGTRRSVPKKRRFGASISKRVADRAECPCVIVH